MRAEDIEFLELIDIDEGNINIGGRRLVLHSVHAFSQFRKDIVDMLGWEHARRLLTRFGFFWGQTDASALQRLFHWPCEEEWIKAGMRLHTLEGVDKATISEFQFERDESKFHMVCTWHRSVEAEGYLMELGPSDHAVCWELLGYVCGFASYATGKSIYFIERFCQGKRDHFCEVEGKDLDSWGDEIKPHLEFFEAEDIKGTVQRLTKSLREKTNALKRHKQELSMLRHKTVPYLVEGRSKVIKNVLDLSSRIAQFDSSVLLTGETGVGKEVLARYIHDCSHRSKGPFVAVNCGALPETLLESELFGHKSGSFTGAVRNRAGLFEEAAKGTIFLDEIGDISQAVQLKILRVLQEKEVLRIGENKPRKIDVRVIAATNKNLNEEVSKGSFREDLLYRLRVIEIEMPALRIRKDDILPLARFLVNRIAQRLGMRTMRLDATCADYLLEYHWPGNVRELENALERAAVISTDGVILPEHLPSQVKEPQITDQDAVGDAGYSLKQVEQAHIRKVLDFTNGNRTQAAKLLGIGQATLWRKLKAMEAE